MSNPKFVVIGLRTGIRSDDSIEVLFLSRGLHARYRLSVSSASLELFRHSSDDLFFEFDVLSDSEVSSYLIESMWRIEVSEADIEFGCETLRRLEAAGLGPPLIADDEHLGLFSNVISTVVEQFRVLKDTDSAALATIGRLEGTFRAIHKNPMLSVKSREVLRNARLAIASIRSAIELQQIRAD
jgi:hypothetical protein